MASVNYSLRDLEPSVFERERSLPCAVDAIPESNASLEVPQKIGEYSLSIDKESGRRDIIFDDSKLSYLYLPPKSHELVEFDLSKEFYEKFKHIDWCSCQNTKLDEFLEWIVRNLDKFAGGDEQKPLGVDFITYRGVLTKLMVTPFVKDKWLIGATKYKNTIYLCPYYENENGTTLQNLFSFGGLRFESYLTRSEPNKVECEPFSSVKSEFSVVIKSKLKSSSGKISILKAAEVDCLDFGKTDKDKDSMDNYVEIKTTRRMHHENQHRNFRRCKLIKWWAQSYLIGVPKIICGYKNNNHVVDQIEQLNVHHIPQQCAPFWSRRQCLNFLYAFLSHVQQLVKEDDPKHVYLFSNDIPNVISARKLLLSNSHFQILPDWYINEFAGPNKLPK